MAKTSKRIALGRAILGRKRPSPFGAFARGVLAGAAGALVQSQFFKVTAKLSPKPTQVPRGLGKPEPEAIGESSLETVARRLVEDFMKRGPIDAHRKGQIGTAIHFGFGAAWGGLYGLLRESLPALPATAFGVAVWMASDNFMLPAFRLSAWPQRYSLAEHHYALHAHVVYGLATAGAYALLRDVGTMPLAAMPAVIALQARSWLARTPPGRIASGQKPLPARLAQTWLNRVARA